MTGLHRLSLLALVLAALATLALPVSQINSTVHDRDIDPAGRFTFVVEIDGIPASAFLSVSGLEAETELIEYRSGNDRTVRKKPGRTKYANVVLRRGYTGNSDLWNWYQQVIRGEFDRKNISIVLLRANQTELERYNLYEAFPVRYKNYELDSSKGMTPVIEEIELSYEWFEKG